MQVNENGDSRLATQANIDSIVVVPSHPCLDVFAPLDLHTHFLLLRQLGSD